MEERGLLQILLDIKSDFDEFAAEADQFIKRVKEKSN